MGGSDLEGGVEIVHPEIPDNDCVEPTFEALQFHQHIDFQCLHGQFQDFCASASPLVRYGTKYDPRLGEPD